MTREEIIDELCRLRSDIVNASGYVNRTDAQKNRFAQALSEEIQRLQMESCEDCISRQAVIDILNSAWKTPEELEVFELVKSLPSVQPKRKNGKWVLIHPLQDDDGGAYACSECHSGDYGCERNKYCRWCGAEMGVE